MDRKLIDYLPIFIQNYAEIEEIMNAEQISIESAWIAAENVMNDQFVTEATENGVSRWEHILSITPKATYTLDERKFNILVRLNEQLPYTLESLKIALTSLCGEGGYSLKLEPDKYQLTVKLAIESENSVEAVTKLLEKMIPANIVTNVTLFNTHGILSDFTHEQLTTYTHKTVREEIL